MRRRVCGTDLCEMINIAEGGHAVDRRLESFAGLQRKRHSDQCQKALQKNEAQILSYLLTRAVSVLASWSINTLQPESAAHFTATEPSTQGI